MYYYGARYYDPLAPHFTTIDPLAENKIWLSVYNFCSNNPINRIDPNGLTDYTLNKKTGEVKQQGNTNDEPDRILKTNRKGEVKYKKNGEAKVAVEDIEQGILKDGMNLKTKNNIFEVGGEGQATEKGVEIFALKLSEYVGKEIAGAYFSKNDGENTTNMTIGMYKKNKIDGASSFGHGLGFNKNLSLTGFFHTHPSTGYGVSDRTVPSDADLDTRDNALLKNPKLLFFIITNPVKYGDDYPYKIPYITGFSRRLK